MQAGNQQGQHYQGNMQNSNPQIQNQNLQQPSQQTQGNMMNSNQPLQNQNSQNPQYNANQQQYVVPPPTATQINTNASQINSTANQPIQNVASPYKNPTELGYQSPNNSQIIQQHTSEVKANIQSPAQRQSIENIQMRSPQQSGLKPNFNEIHNST